MNYLAVLTVVILNHVLGFLWYGVLFAAPWMAAAGKTQAELKPDHTPYIVAVVGSVFMAVVLSKIIQSKQINSPIAGARLAVVLWAGFILPILATHYLFLGYGFDLILIDAGKELIGTLLMGAILAGWQPGLSKQQLMDRV